MLESYRGAKPYVIAEIGGNHGGDFERAREYLRTAADAGADAVKFQMYRAENLIVEDEPPLPLAGDDYDSQYERFKELELTDGQWRDLAALADEHDVDFAASVFDEEMADLAAELSPFIKIASGDLTNVPLLRYVNDIGDPVVMSTGFSTIDEVRRAISELPDVDLTLLHCVGSYPTPDDEAHLEMIDVLSETFDLPVGYSDHTVGTRVPLAAIARGAGVLEKHFTLDKTNEVGDHRLSATPEELSRLVEESERIFSMFGSADRSKRLDVEDEIRDDMRRSLALREPVEGGERIREEVLTALRPSTGISPTRLDEVVGRRLNESLPARTILTKDHLDANGDYPL